MSNPLRLLFVCTGNICRSPMAEGIAIAHGERIGLEVASRSCGTLGVEEYPADPKAVAVCGEIGVNIDSHRSQGVTNELVDWADYILVMELRHAQYVREYHPQVGETKVLMLGTFGGQYEIPDPVGGWKFQFRRSRKQIERCISGFLGRVDRGDLVGR